MHVKAGWLVQCFKEDHGVTFLAVQNKESYHLAMLWDHHNICVVYEASLISVAVFSCIEQFSDICRNQTFYSIL